MGTFKFIQKRSLIDEAEIHGYEANGIGKSTPVTANARRGIYPVATFSDHRNVPEVFKRFERGNMPRPAPDFPRGVFMPDCFSYLLIFDVCLCVADYYVKPTYGTSSKCLL